MVVPKGAWVSDHRPLLRICWPWCWSGWVTWSQSPLPWVFVLPPVERGSRNLSLGLESVGGVAGTAWPQVTAASPSTDSELSGPLRAAPHSSCLPCPGICDSFQVALGFGGTIFMETSGRILGLPRWC